VGAWGTEEGAIGGGDEFGNPMLRVNEGFAPLFGVDDGTVGAGGCLAGGHLHGGVHAGDECFPLAIRVDDRGDEANVFVDVGKGVWGEGEDGQTRFEDSCEGLHAVGHAGQD